jgi:hypothetical protein
VREELGRGRKLNTFVSKLLGASIVAKREEGGRVKINSLPTFGRPLAHNT